MIIYICSLKNGYYSGDIYCDIQNENIYVFHHNNRCVIYKYDKKFRYDSVKALDDDTAHSILPSIINHVVVDCPPLSDAELHDLVERKTMNKILDSII